MRSGIPFRVIDDMEEKDLIEITEDILYGTSADVSEKSTLSM